MDGGIIKLNFGFISHLIGCETINIPEIFSDQCSQFNGKDCKPFVERHNWELGKQFDLFLHISNVKRDVQVYITIYQGSIHSPLRLGEKKSKPVKLAYGLIPEINMTCM